MSRVYNDYYFTYIQPCEDEYNELSDALPQPTEEEIETMFEHLISLRGKTGTET